MGTLRKLGLGIIGLVAAEGTADAFSTRVHIVLSNDVREALIASDDGRTIALKSSPYSVKLSEEDARAIMMQPLAYRAGAVGPDNMAFPAMTDPSHALYQRPYVQCDVLYKAASNDEERAYALGCFLHGATDAIAHHYVNYMTDETFTLYPMRTNRMYDFVNVVRHIVAEGMIQSSAVKLRPMAFAQGQLVHAIPTSYVARTYFDDKSELFPYFAGHAKTKLDAAVAANPNKAFLLVAGSDAGLAPAEHLSLVSVYVGKVDGLRADAKTTIEKTITDLQNKNTPDGMKLNVGPGNDGKLGTKDDTTSCTASCASIYAQYFVSVGLLAPRTDANNNPLPSAFDKISEKLGTDVRNFVPAYLQTIGNISLKFNTPVGPNDMEKLDFQASEVQTLFAPMIQWSDSLTTIDYTTLSNAVVPGWLIAIQNALQNVGINLSVPDIMKALLQPIVQPIQDLIKKRLVDEASAFLQQLATSYTTLLPTTRGEYGLRLQTISGGQPGVLDNFFDSGIYVNAFNLAAATMAQRGLVLPESPSDPVGVGPASFDTSHTVAWTQAGVCDYLRDAIFPFGIDTKGLLTVKNGSGTFTPKITDDSAIECHDGQLDKFSSSPNVQACGLTDLPKLAMDRRGSLSRGFPPSLSATGVTCRNLTVAGLPPPPAMNGADAGGPGFQTDPAKGGCGCNTTSPTSGAASMAALLALLSMTVVRRKRGGR